MSLTEKQRKHLRKLAHNMKPVIIVGNAGASDALLAELDQTIEHHELIKVKVNVGDRDVRDEVIAEITGKSGAELVGRVGNIATIFRARSKDSKIQLPK